MYIFGFEVRKHDYVPFFRLIGMIFVIGHLINAFAGRLGGAGLHSHGGYMGNVTTKSEGCDGMGPDGNNWLCVHPCTCELELHYRHYARLWG